MSNTEKREYDPTFHTDSNNAKQIGHLDVDLPHNARGKKITVWKYLVNGGKPVPNNPDFNPVIEIDIHLHKGDYKSDVEVYFLATSSSLPKPIKHADLNALKKLVTQELDKQAELQLSIKWEQWLKVTVSGSTAILNEFSYQGMGALTKFEASYIPYGKDEKTGELFTIDKNFVIRPFPKPIRIGEEYEEMEYTRGLMEKSPVKKLSKVEISYIPASEENIQGLLAISAKMDQLKHALSDLLSQEKIESSVLHISEKLMIQNKG